MTRNAGKLWEQRGALSSYLCGNRALDCKGPDCQYVFGISKATWNKRLMKETRVYMHGQNSVLAQVVERENIERENIERENIERERILRERAGVERESMV